MVRGNFRYPGAALLFVIGSSPPKLSQQRKYQKVADHTATTNFNLTVSRGERASGLVLSCPFSSTSMIAPRETLACSSSIALSLRHLRFAPLSRAHLPDRRACLPGIATDRIFACWEQLGLREDSAAAQWCADVIHAWIDPEGSWEPPGGHPDARSFLIEAVIRLQRYLGERTV